MQKMIRVFRKFRWPLFVVIGLTLLVWFFKPTLFSLFSPINQSTQTPPSNHSFSVSDQLPKRRFEVIFDQSNEQVYTPFDTHFTGMSIWSLLIQEQGGDLSLNSAPLAHFLESLEGPHQVLVLGVALERRYPPEDIEAVDRFLKRGGGVLVLVEHDNLMENASFQNELLARYGIVAHYGHNETLKPSRMSIWTWAEAPEWGYEEVQFFFPAPLIIDQDGVMAPFLTISEPLDPELPVIGARARPKSGLNLMVLGDAEMVWNAHPPIGMTIGENPPFMARVITTLAQVDYWPEGGGRNFPSLIQPDEKSVDGKLKPRALFLRDGDAQIPDSRQHGFKALYQFLKNKGYQVDIAHYSEVKERVYSLVFSLSPLSQFELPETWLQRHDRVVVASDGQSDFFNSIPEMHDLLSGFYPEEKIPTFETPANSLLKGVGLRFDSSTLVDGEFGEHGLVVQIEDQKGRRYKLTRPAWVRSLSYPLEKRGDHTEDINTEIHDGVDLIACAKGAWPSACLTPLLTNEVPRPLFTPPDGMELEPCYPVIAKSGNRIAVGSLSLFYEPELFIPLVEQLEELERLSR